MKHEIRLADERDLPGIVAIYNEAIATGIATAHTRPVRPEDRLEWFLSHLPSRHPIWVAEDNSAILGWACLSPYRPGREALKRTAELSYYVSREFQKRGVATALVETVIRTCPKLGIETLFGIVLEPNQTSMHLLRKFGFEEWGRLPQVAELKGKKWDHLYFGRHLR